MKRVRRPLLAVIDYGMGNLRSVQKALEKMGARVVVTDARRTIESADGVVLPGVGSFGEAARRLRQKGIDRSLGTILKSGKPFLGICLGLQLLFEGSEESPQAKGLGFFKGRVVRFQSKRLKIPHMGWNTLDLKSRSGCLRGIKKSDHFYFVHSFFPKPKSRDVIAATTRYGSDFCSVAAKGNVMATQFHPEKSGQRGLRLLSQFIKGVQQCS